MNRECQLQLHEKELRSGSPNKEQCLPCRDGSYGWWVFFFLSLCFHPAKNTEVGSHSLLQGILLTQGPNPGLLHCRQILYHLDHEGLGQQICANSLQQH